MFEKRKTITVNGVSFDMILVEGDKFSIGDKEYELEDFYMAEIPVTQGLYRNLMGPEHRASYEVFPKIDNFFYNSEIEKLKKYERDRQFQREYIRQSKFPGENVEEYKIRLEKERIEKEEREKSERERKEKEKRDKENFLDSLPVNNISWPDCLIFIERLNNLSGLNFALPSFEQWYFAASGGIESKGYTYPGWDDPNYVGHFHKILKSKFTPGLYVMTGETKESPNKIVSENKYQAPGRYKPNELGLFDMVGLVNEWLDEAGMIIGGSFFSDPIKISKKNLYGYSSFDKKNLFGFRLVLNNKSKKYQIPREPEIKYIPSNIEKEFIKRILKSSNLGVIRSVICKKFEKNKIGKHGEYYTYSDYGRILGGVYNVFICPQNIKGMYEETFKEFKSRRKFINYCKDEFKKLIYSLINDGFDIIIKDDLGLNLEESDTFFTINEKNINIFTNNLRIIDNKEVYEGNKNIIIQIKETHEIELYKTAYNEWIWNNSNVQNLRVVLNCFCDFKGDLFDFKHDYAYSKNPNDTHAIGFVRFIKDKNLIERIRINEEGFNNTYRVNRIFCKRNKGGLYDYEYDSLSLSTFLVQDERFFVMPQGC